MLAVSAAPVRWRDIAFKKLGGMAVVTQAFQGSAAAIPFKYKARRWRALYLRQRLLERLDLRFVLHFPLDKSIEYFFRMRTPGTQARLPGFGCGSHQVIFGGLRAPEHGATQSVRPPHGRFQSGKCRFAIDQDAQWVFMQLDKVHFAQKNRYVEFFCAISPKSIKPPVAGNIFDKPTGPCRSIHKSKGSMDHTHTSEPGELSVRCVRPLQNPLLRGKGFKCQQTLYKASPAV